MSYNVIVRLVFEPCPHPHGKASLALSKLCVSILISLTILQNDLCAGHLFLPEFSHGNQCRT